MNNKNLSPVNDLSSRTFDDLFARFQELDTECLLIYLFDKVEESALIHLAEQFHITGNEGWSGCTTIEEKRELIKNSINLHRFRGTKFALVRVLEILGLNGKVLEWFDYDGLPYHFKVTVDMNNKGFDGETEKKLIDLIFANKNVRSKLESLTINLINSATQRFTSYAVTSEELTLC
ncbi:phage tail protein I [bacterium]|nr:phage tail protein I [bacterium]